MDCIAITLPTGLALYATTGQMDITFTPNTPGWGGPLTTFRASQFGIWSRGAITSEASTKLASGTMSLTCNPPPGTVYPGLTLSLLNAVHNHLFDVAAVWVYSAYMPLGAYGDTSAGIEVMFQGTITRVPKLGRSSVEFECGDPFYLLNLKTPSKLIQSNCPWSFADVNCALSPANYTASITAGAGTNQGAIVGSIGQPDGYFTQGVATCFSGANRGLSQTVKAHAGGVITLTAPWVLPVAVGDIFTVLKGCDKTLTTCKSVVSASGFTAPADNSIHYGGYVFTPAPNQAV